MPKNITMFTKWNMYKASLLSAPLQMVVKDNLYPSKLQPHTNMVITFCNYSHTMHLKLVGTSYYRGRIHFTIHIWKHMKSYVIWSIITQVVFPHLTISRPFLESKTFWTSTLKHIDHHI
jgi:hypothetical protein